MRPTEKENRPYLFAKRILIGNSSPLSVPGRSSSIPLACHAPVFPIRLKAAIGAMDLCLLLHTVYTCRYIRYYRTTSGAQNGKQNGALSNGCEPEGWEL